MLFISRKLNTHCSLTMRVHWRYIQINICIIFKNTWCRTFYMFKTQEINRLINIVRYMNRGYWCRNCISGLLDTGRLYPILVASMLHRETLGYLWSLVNNEIVGQLTVQECYMLLALIGLVQVVDWEHENTCRRSHGSLVYDTCYVSVAPSCSTRC